MEERELVVIGGGPAGYVAALRASQLGAGVTLVEEKKLGGVCLNTGCIPTKLLLHSAEMYESIKTAEQRGISTAGISLDLAKMQAHKDRVIPTLVSGIKGLLDNSRAELINGRAKFISPKQVEIDSGQGKKQVVQAEKIIIATGSKPKALPVPGADRPGIMDTESVLNLDYLPRSLVMIGGGAVGVEIATIWAKLGCKVSIVEMMSHILPTQDAELASILEGILREEGVQICCGARVSRIEDVNGGRRAILSDGEAEQRLEAEVVAVSVGRKPNTEGLGLNECGVAVDKGGIRTDEGMRSNVSNIYAAGDVTGGMMLAHVSFAEGKVAAENAMGRDPKMDYRAVPQCIFTLPEVASVGLTEEEAIAQGYQIRVGRFPFAANGMAVILGEQRGLVKVITEQKYGQVLGVHIIGPRATTLIPEATLAMKLEATSEDIITTIHAHPTLSEALWESALDATDGAIHFASRRG